jgi:hypothetical protein
MKRPESLICQGRGRRRRIRTTVTTFGLFIIVV